MSVTDALGNITSFKYDTAGRKASVTRPNGQVTTYNSYDTMNRLLRQNVTQTPDPSAVTKFTYTTAGLLATMQDPRLVALGTGYKYKYAYDLMGRKTKLTYPPDSSNVQRTELFAYDTAGRLYTFTNRAGKRQTFTYDALNRMTGFSWNDGLTPSVTLGYDVASRLISINNANATISHVYTNDNLLKNETSTYSDNTARTVTYTYNADGKRATIQYPNGAYSFTYRYTGRNQLKTLVNNSGGATVMTYGYDPDGNLATRTPDNSTTSTYSYDAMDRVAHITHSLVADTRTFDYAYDNVGNRSWTKRDGGTGDVFGYDLDDQVTATLLNIANPDTTSVGSQTITYDANGNRITFAPYGATDSYVTNNLNQYSSLNSAPITYDVTGNLASLNGGTTSYDAQNRLLNVAGTNETFAYDGLNRQVSRTLGGVTTYNVYDGWDLIGEYASGATSPSNAYLSGAGGLVKNLTTGNYYYQDGSGSTSHLADSTGHLLEWYRYDLQGTPVFYNFLNTQQSSSAYGIRHLFTGQQWYSELGLYDMRNRFYSPAIGRFLQPDPIGFNGDATNLYRYCGNNPAKWVDPSGLVVTYVGGPYDLANPNIQEVERVVVTGDFPGFNNYYNDHLAAFELNTYGAFHGDRSFLSFVNEESEFNIGDRLPPSPPSKQPNSTLSATDPYATGNTISSPTPNPSPTPSPNQWVQQQGITLMVGGGIIVVAGVGLIVLSPATAPAGVTITLAGGATAGLGLVLWVGGFVSEQQEDGH